jgi:hemolysin III
MAIPKSIKEVQESIQDVQETIQDEIASKAKRKSTLKSLKLKKKFRLRKLRLDYENEVREIHIQYSRNPERLKAKYAADNYARSEKKKARAQRRIEQEQRAIEYLEKERPLTTHEEIASAIVQGLGVALFIAALAILDTLGVRDGMAYKSLTVVCFTLFSAFMILMYLFSCLHHAITAMVPKLVFERLSHVFTFLCMGFSYTTFTITKIQGLAGWILFGYVWGVSAIGVLFYAISGRKHLKLNKVLYALAGVSLYTMTGTLYSVLSTQSFAMLICAAAFYTIGFLFYNLRKYRFMHFVGNCFFLAANIYMFFALFFIGV